MKVKITEKYYQFKSNYEKLAGKVYLAEKPSQAVKFVEHILSSTPVSKAVVAPIFDDLENKLLKFFKRVKFPTVTIKSEGTPIAHQINEADVGITTAEFAIAFTGTIVEVTTEDTHRLVSSLPRVHIAFLDCSQIVDSLEEAAPRLGKIYRKHRANCAVTFISGPSRTADIEMKLFLGVHGPQESHVIVCNWKRKKSDLRQIFNSQGKIQRLQTL
jgi:L-lactate dehydrogenase complex protein LldG